MDADHRQRLLNTLALLPDDLTLVVPASGDKYAGLVVRELRELLLDYDIAMSLLRRDPPQR